MSSVGGESTLVTDHLHAAWALKITDGRALIWDVGDMLLFNIRVGLTIAITITMPIAITIIAIAIPISVTIDAVCMMHL